MSTIYICSDIEHDMDPFLAVGKEAVKAALEDLCGGYLDCVYEPRNGHLEIYWFDNLGEHFTVRCVPQTEIYGDKEALDQLKVA